MIKVVNMKIAVTGVKGGVGKSTIAYSIMKEALEEGNYVLFIDMDKTHIVSNLLGVKGPTRMGKLTIIPFHERIDLEGYERDVNVEIIDSQYEVLLKYPKFLESSLVVLVTNEIPIVLNSTVEFGKQLKSQHHVKNIILIINMAKGEVKYVNEFPVLRIPFSYTLLYKGISYAPSFIKIWNEIKSVT